MKSTRKGFTLVELIVVIAILGILAGVAIPVYSGYIKRARQAADNTLLSAVNTAFGASCYEKGFTNLKQINAWIKLKDDNTVGNVGVSRITAGNAEATSLTKSFNKYFKGNQDTAFKYYTGLVYDADNGCFVGTFRATASAKDGNGNDVVYNEASIAAYQDSNFADMEPEDTVQLVDTLVGGVLDNSASIASLKNDTRFTAYLTSVGLNSNVDSEVARGLVLYVADRMAGFDADVIAKTLTGNFNTDLPAMYQLATTGESATFSEKAVSAAMLYALTYSYANSSVAPEDLDLQSFEPENGVSDVGSLTTYMAPLYASQEFKDYLQSEEMRDDVAGLIGALTTVNDNEQLVLNYVNASDGHFNNDDLLDIVREFLVQNN